MINILLREVCLTELCQGKNYKTKYQTRGYTGCLQLQRLNCLIP